MRLLRVLADVRFITMLFFGGSVVDIVKITKFRDAFEVRISEPVWDTKSGIARHTLWVFDEVDEMGAYKEAREWLDTECVPLKEKKDV